MSGFRSPKSTAGAKAAGDGSTHRSNAKPRAAGGAKASGGPHGVSTHESLSPDRRAKAGATASQSGRNSVVAPESGFYHGTERVTEHHRK